MRKNKLLHTLLIAVCAVMLTLGLAACEKQKVTVLLDAGGGTCEVTAVTAEKGRTAAPPPAPYKEGFIFTGWYTAADSGRLWNFAKDKVTGDMTLYAQYQDEGAVAHVQFILGADDGEVVENAPLPLDVAPGNLVPEPARPLREGYIFAGWFKDEQFTEEFHFSEKLSESSVSYDKKLYAKWLRLHKYSFDSGLPGLNFPDILVEDGKKPTAVTSPAFDGKVFMGWYAADGSLFDPQLKAESDMSFTARWETATAKEKLTYSKSEWEVAMVVNGLSDKFTGGELVIPDSIDGIKVTRVDLSGEFVCPEKIVLPGNVTDFYIKADKRPALGYSVSALNTIYKDFRGHLYTTWGDKNWNFRYASASRLIELMPGSIFPRDVYDTLLIEGECPSDFSVGQAFYIVDDKYYAGYLDAVDPSEQYRICPRSKADFKNGRVVTDGKLINYFGAAQEITLGVTDGITSIGDNALPVVPVITLGAGITQVDGFLVRYTPDYGNTQLKLKLLSTPDFLLPGNVLAYMGDLEIITDYTNALSLQQAFLSQYSKHLQFETAEEFFVKDGYLVRYYGNESKVILPPGLLGIYSFAFPKDCNVTDIYFPAADTFALKDFSDSWFNSTIYRSSLETVNLYFPAGKIDFYYPEMYVERLNQKDFHVNIYIDDRNCDLSVYTDRYKNFDGYSVISWGGYINA